LLEILGWPAPQNRSRSLSWLGNSPRIAQQSYLLVTEDDFAKTAGAKKVMVEGKLLRKKRLGF
jgi:hypothetical protein